MHVGLYEARGGGAVVPQTARGRNRKYSPGRFPRPHRPCLSPHRGAKLYCRRVLSAGRIGWSFAMSMIRFCKVATLLVASLLFVASLLAVAPAKAAPMSALAPTRRRRCGSIALLNTMGFGTGTSAPAPSSPATGPASSHGVARTFSCRIIAFPRTSDAPSSVVFFGMRGNESEAVIVSQTAANLPAGDYRQNGRTRGSFLMRAI